MAVKAFHGREMALEELKSRTRLLITDAQLNVLECLREGPMRLTDMAASLRLSPPSITRQVQSLEKKGLIVRTPDKTDGRATILSLSPRGAQAVSGMEVAVRGLLQRVVTEWSDEDLQQAAPVLERLCDSIDRFEAGAPLELPPWQSS
jgi:DNA-binding MarR family transcriptional regulator